MRAPRRAGDRSSAPFTTLLLALTLTITGAAAAHESAFEWDAHASVHSSYSVGDLADLAAVSPGDLGPDGLLTREDLEVAGEDYTVQGVLTAGLDGGARLAWVRGLAELELVTSLLVRYSPQGFGAADVVIAPGESGVRIVRRPAEWYGGRLAVSLGRFRLAEGSGLVVSQLADGAGFAVRFPRLYVSLHGGVTGLLSPYLFAPRLLPGDTVDAAERLAPQRLIAVARAEYAGLAAQDAGVFAVYYDDRAPEVGQDSVYAGFAARGVLLGEAGPLTRLSHETALVLQWRTDDAGTALLGALVLEAQGFGFLTLQANASYASGNGGGLVQFMPLTPRSVGRVIAVPRSNLFVTGLEVAARAGALVPSLRGDLFFSATGPDPFLGAEIAAGAAAGLLPDLELDAHAGVARSPLGWTPFARAEGRVRL